jgi:hypothetical protein
VTGFYTERDGTISDVSGDDKRLFAFKGVEKSDRLEKESRILENVSSHTNKN